MDTVTVDAKALHKVLQAALGMPHLMLELQTVNSLAKRGLVAKVDDPLGILVYQYNEAADSHNAKVSSQQKEGGE